MHKGATWGTLEARIESSTTNILLPCLVAFKLLRLKHAPARYLRSEQHVSQDSPTSRSHGMALGVIICTHYMLRIFSPFFPFD